MKGLALPDRDRWLLEACLRNDARAVESFANWRRFANPDHMEGRELRLMPALHANMQRLGLSDSRLAWIGGQAKHIWLSGMLRRKMLLEALNLLERAGVDFILMKGAALMARYPEAVKTRPSGDFDLLIRRESARTAMAALNESGWRGALGEAFAEADLDRYHAIGLSDPRGAAIDLHWRPAAAIAAPRHAEGAWERRISGRLDDRPVSIVSLADHLFILLAHAFHDDIEQRSDWIAEVELLFRLAPTGGWDWKLFHRLAKDFQLDRWIQSALLTAQDLIGRPLPKGAFQRPLFSSVWRGTLQDREIALRGHPATSPSDLKARQNGQEARGFFNQGFDRTTPPDLAVALALQGQSLTGREAEAFAAFPKGVVFLQGWSFPEEGWRWTEADACVFCLPVPGGAAGDPFHVRMRLTPFSDLRDRLKADVWAGDDMASWDFAMAPEGGSFTMRGRLIAHEKGALAAVWLGLEGIYNDDEMRSFTVDSRRLGVRVDQIDLLSTADLDERVPTLDKRIPLNGAESGLLAWTGWAPPESFGRWSVGDEVRLLFRLPPAEAGAVKAVALDILHVFANGAPVSFDVRIAAEAPVRVRLPEAEGMAAPGVSPGGIVRVAIPKSCAPGSLVEMIISLRDLVSPQELGESEDRRKLGLAVAAIAPDN